MRVRYLLLHAYGTGGTIRTVINQANTLVAAGHEIELVSLLRHKDEVWFPLDPRVKVTALTDGRPSAPTAEPATGRLAARRRRREEKWRDTPPLYVPQGEFGIRYFNRYVEKVLEEYLKGLRDGILVTTRPALNILAARYATKGVVRVAQEHMNLSVHRQDVQEAIKETTRASTPSPCSPNVTVRSTAGCCPACGCCASPTRCTPWTRNPPTTRTRWCSPPAGSSLRRASTC